MTTTILYCLVRPGQYCLITCQKIICLLLSILFLYTFNGFAQSTPIDSKLTDITYQKTAARPEPISSDYDEILIILNVPRIGSIEIPAVIYQEIVYLPVKEFFDFLKIRNTSASDLSSVEGFFINPNATYSIDKSQNQIVYEGKKYELQSSDIIITSSGLYLNAFQFGRVFGLNCQFNFRSLSVNLVTGIELPALREMKLEAMHRNLNVLKGEKKADTIINRRFSFFHMGTFDWSVLSARETNVQNNTRVTLGIGANFAGGETNLFLNYYNNRSFKLSDQFYYWRYVNNAHKALRQVTLGKILSNPSSTIFSGINGIQITNTPTTFRRSFGSYQISDKTEPGWLVELYVNNVLVNYTRADASGFFTFDVPMVYGNSVVRLRFFGPWGEERNKEQNLAIPFNFLPKNQFEYTLNAGIIEDNQKGRFSRAQFNYGVNNYITVGGGVEYLSSVSKKAMPFLNASLRLVANLFVTGEYIQGVRSKGIISYRLPSDIRIELNYLRYDRDQKAIKINFLEEKKIVISRPFRGPKYSAFARLTVDRFSYSTISKYSKYSSAELLVSAVAYGISSNLLSYAILNEAGIPLAFTNLSITFRLPHGINFLPQAQYEYTLKKFTRAKAEMEKSLFKRGFLNLSYEWDFKNKNYVAGVGLRYNLSFMQTAVSVRRSKQNTESTVMARGSILYNSKTNYIGLNNQNNVGKGGLIIAPYFDLNFNGKREPGEPAAPGLKLRINGGHIQRNDRDTIIRVTGLDAYTSYFLELDKNSFENIAWQLRKSTFSITIDPNHFTILEVPVMVAGEVSGTVYLQKDISRSGLGRIVVNIYNSDSVFVSRTITESDGYFSYLGLSPGKYIVLVDPDQLKKLNMQSSSVFLPITINNSKDGDAVGGLVFVLSNNTEKK